MSLRDGYTIKLKPKKEFSMTDYPCELTISATVTSDGGLHDL